MSELDRHPFDYLSHYTKDAEAFDYFEERQGATAHSERRLREYILSLVPRNTFSVLDVGCGSAWVAHHFQHSGTFVCSLDVSIANTSRAVQSYHSKDHVAVVADTYALPFKDDSFDVVIASEVIEHLHDPATFAQELLRVVKRGGVVIVSTPFQEKIVYEVCIHCQELTPHNAHLQSFDEEKLVGLFRAAGASDTQFFAFNNKLLLFGRTYPVLRFLPFRLWRTLDQLVSVLVNKKVNSVISVTK